jgi:isoleucyl-tRNA synthetase
LRRLVVEGATPRHTDEIADEVNVKAVELGAVEAELRIKPNLPALGPRLGRELRTVQQALQAGEFEELPGGRFRAAGHELGPDEVLVERLGREGFAIASSDGVTVALDTSVDDELLLERRVRDLIRQVNVMRKDQGLELTDRIVLTVPAELEPLLRYEEQIKGEVLAVEIRVDGDAGVSIARV